MKKYWELFSSFFKIGILTFGGGIAMLPMLNKEVIQKRGWTTEEEILDYYAIGQCTPGIIAVNTATFIGDKIAGAPGAFFSTFGVVCPSMIIITLIATVLKTYMDYPLVACALTGIRVAVCALTLNAAIGLARKAIKDWIGIVIYIVIFLLAYFTSISAAILVIAAGAAGILIKSREVKRS